MTTARRCSRTACRRPAVATLTYVYSDQTAVLGPLATYAEPHAYDLCDEHSDRLSAPRGWEVVRLALDPDALGPSTDDLLALADAVREAAREQHPSATPGGTRVRPVPAEAGVTSRDPLGAGVAGGRASDRGVAARGSALPGQLPPGQLPSQGTGPLTGQTAGHPRGDRRSHLRVLRPTEE